MGSLSTAKPGRKAGAAPGPSRPERKPAANKKATKPAAADAILTDPPFPDGWTARQWAALCNSQANRDAHRLFTQVETLVGGVRAFLGHHGEAVDLHPLAAAKVGTPTGNVAHLSHVRHHLAGLLWPLEQFVCPVADVLPDPPATDDSGEPISFAVYHAAILERNPEYGHRLANSTPDEFEREKARQRRAYAYEASQVYRDAHAIFELAERLHGRMESFVAEYDGAEGFAALKAAGAVPPASGDTDEGDRPELHFASIREAVAGHLFNLGKLVEDLDTVTDSPVRLKGAA